MINETPLNISQYFPQNSPDIYTWCKEQVDYAIQETQTLGLKIIAISLILLVIASIINDYSQHLSIYLEIKEETVLRISNSTYNLAQIIMAISLIYFYFIK